MSFINFYTYSLSGIMYHHFHDDLTFSNSQGSINESEFELTLKAIKKKVQILSPSDFIENINSKIPEKATCITFDDGLLSQYKIAKPVLDSLGIKAFFFVYSAIWDEKVSDPLLEYFRDFRNSFKGGIDKYYESFFIEVSKMLNKNHKEIIFPKKYLSDCPFYTFNDKKYRFFRDTLLKPDQYEEIVEKMLRLNNYSLSLNKKKLFMTLENLSHLISEGHEVGLHSHTHPTDMNRLSQNQIKNEYYQNYKFIKNILLINPRSISYPCGIFNCQTESVMNELNIKVGFAASLSQYPFDSFNKFLLPREDHINILNRL